MSKENPKKLGLWTTTSLVVGNMIGSGVFLMPVALAVYGGISVFGWIFSAIGALLLAKVFSNLSKYMPISDGGPYAYSRQGMGDFAGFLVGWGYLLSVYCTNAALAVAFVSAMSTFFPILAVDNFVSIITGLGTIWFLTWINSLGLLASGKMQLTTTILKIIPLVMVSVGGLFYFQIDHFIPFNLSIENNFNAITATATLTFFSFQGLECATIPSTGVNNPETTIPKATMMGTILVTILYILSSVSIMGVISSEVLQKSVTPFADASTVIFGPTSAYWVAGGVAIAAFGTLNGFILVQGQVSGALAADGLFPAIFNKKNKNNVQGYGLYIGSAIASIIMCMNYTKGLASQFTFLILMSTLLILVPYLMSTASYVLLRMQVKNHLTPWWRVITVATLAFVYSLWAVLGSGQETVYYGFIILISGIPIYVLMMWKNQKKEI